MSFPVSNSCEEFTWYEMNQLHCESCCTAQRLKTTVSGFHIISNRAVRKSKYVFMHVDNNILLTVCI